MKQKSIERTMIERIAEDFMIYNDGNDFSIGSGTAQTKYDTDSLIADKNFMAVGDFICLELFEDNCVNVRVVIGELTEQEEAEWVGRVRSKLDLRCGKLGVSSALVMFDEDPDETAFNFIRVPPDEYQVDVYAYFPSFTGVAKGLRDELTGPESTPVAQWFRESRPGEDMPNWLVYECLESYDADPGNDDFWERREKEMDDEQYDLLAEKAGKYVEFLIHLTALDEDPPVPELYKSGSCKWHARSLKKCPIGLYSDAIESDLI